MANQFLCTSKSVDLLWQQNNYYREINYGSHDICTTASLLCWQEQQFDQGSCQKHRSGRLPAHSLLPLALGRDADP